MSQLIHNYFGTGYVPKEYKTLFGIEVEIENATPEWADDLSHWTCVTDGSLRNSGFEFISDVGTLDETKEKIQELFNRFRKSRYFNPVIYDHFSERTSIHVHTNVANLTWDELKSILVLYQITETLLFKFVGHDRENNIFCVPWSQTKINYNLVNNLDGFVRNCSIDRNKYTALNLVPILDKGSIEWRHFPGSDNVVKLFTWLDLINRYFVIAKSYSYEYVENKLKGLNTSSEYDQVLDWLFGPLALFLMFPGYKLHLENGVLDFKYSIINPNEKNKITFEREETFADEPEEDESFNQAVALTSNEGVLPIPRDIPF